MEAFLKDKETILKNKGLNPYKILGLSKKNFSLRQLNDKVGSLGYLSDDIVLCHQYLLLKIKGAALSDNMNLDLNKEEPLIFDNSKVSREDVPLSDSHTEFISKNNKFLKSKFNKVFEEKYGLKNNPEEVKILPSKGNLSATDIIYSEGVYIITGNETDTSLKESGPPIDLISPIDKKDAIAKKMEKYNTERFSLEKERARVLFAETLSRK